MEEEDESSPAPHEKALGAFRSSLRAIQLVWSTSRPLTVLLAVSTLAAGLAPAGAAYVARIVVDEVVAAAAGDVAARSTALLAMGMEAALLGTVVAAQRGLTYCQQLLRVELAHSVTHLILDKAVTLRLRDFEDPSVNDRMEEVRREATVRPLGLVVRTFALIRQTLSLVGYFAILFHLSFWAVLVLVAGGVPSFIAEARFSEETFRFFRRHSPENRERQYIETLLTREEFAKEIGFFGLGKALIGRYDALFERLYGEDRRLAKKRHVWGLVLGVVGTAAFFGAYVWIVLSTIDGVLTLGQMTMYLVVFRQGQSAVTAALGALGGIYEDALYLENLDAFLAHPVSDPEGVATDGPDPSDGLRVEGVTFTYPGAREPALSDVSFHLPPGRTLAVVGHNGSGKSTLVKLLTRRYVADRGRILLDGLDLRDWSAAGLRARVSVLFQDYNRYKLTAGQNIGAGDPPHLDDEGEWRRAAAAALASDLVEELPEKYGTRLGKSFRGATELSGGQWQRLAFARALMRRDVGLLVFDEPTSAADPKRQAELDERLQELLDGCMGLIVSHRLATARLADDIVVLDCGRLAEQGTHERLLSRGGLYAELFRAQADAYQ